MDVLQGEDTEMRTEEVVSGTGHRSATGKRTTINMDIFDEVPAENTQGKNKEVPDTGRLPETCEGGHRLCYPPIDISGIPWDKIGRLRAALSSWLYGGISTSNRTWFTD